MRLRYPTTSDTKGAKALKASFFTSPLTAEKIQTSSIIAYYVEVSPPTPNRTTTPWHIQNGKQHLKILTTFPKFWDKKPKPTTKGDSKRATKNYFHIAKIYRVATAQGKQGIWFVLFPDRENTGNFVATQGKFLRYRENIFDCIN